MIGFTESNFYKALQDFFINNYDKDAFLEMLAEFYNRTEGIIDKNNIQDDLIKELRELYLEFNEKGIDENIVREKVNYFLENSVKIQDIITKILKNTNNIKNINSQLDTIDTVIKNVDDIQNLINSSQGNVKFESKTYTLTEPMVIKGNTTYNGNNCTINITKDTNIRIPKGSQYIHFKNFNFIGNLKHTKIVELLDNGFKIKCEENVFNVGDKLGASIYGKTDKPYVTVSNFDGTYYTLDTSLSENGNILNSKFGKVIGTFSWSSLIDGGKNNDNIIIENCTFTNSFGYSIALPNTSNIKIENCKFENNGLDFLLLSAEDRNVNNITIKGCKFNKNIDFGKQGIVCTSNGYILEDMIIELNEFSNISESGISFSYAEGHFKNISIRNNRFKKNYLHDIHICGDGIEISNNIFEENKQCSIRIGDVSSVIYPITALLDNININNNIINAKNGIVISPMKVKNNTIIYPKNCNIDFNKINTEYVGIECSGNGLNIRNNFIKCDKNNGAPNYASTILINNVHGVNNEFINIKNNQFEGQIELKWLNSRIINIENNVFNKNLFNKMIRIQDMSSSKLTDTKVKIKNNVFYKSPLMSLQTGPITQKTEYSLNTLIDGETITLIPFMKGRECYYSGTVNDWKFSHDNNNAITKDNYFESNGKFIYIASDGTIKVTSDVTNIS